MAETPLLTVDIITRPYTFYHFFFDRPRGKGSSMQNAPNFGGGDRARKMRRDATFVENISGGSARSDFYALPIRSTGLMVSPRLASAIARLMSLKS